MVTVTTSIFVELEIKVSGTHVKGCPESYNPPSPAEPAGWEDITVEGISTVGGVFCDGKPLLILPPYARDVLNRNAWGRGALEAFLYMLAEDFRVEIESALTAELPDGPDPDHARDAAIDRDLMGYDR